MFRPPSWLASRIAPTAAGFPRRAAEAFTSSRTCVVCLRTHRICSPPDYRQFGARRTFTSRDSQLCRTASISSLPSPLSADSFRLCSNGSSVLRRCPTPRGCACGAVRPKPSPAVLRLIFAAGIPEVSRFSCMKLLGVSGVFDYAGLNEDSRYRPIHVAFRAF